MAALTPPAGESPSRATPRTLFGHPLGLATLFLTEMWERFTHYGMRAILVLFMVSPAAERGLGIPDQAASSIYGLFVASCYLLSLPGGWVADRLIGPQRAVACGGACIVLGNALLASGTLQSFSLGLTVIALGVGLLKPNISVLVGHLYPEGGARRDAGFSLFYMGINVGALLGAVLVPISAARFGWHAGFVLPTIGMFLGLVQFLLTRRSLGAPDRRPPMRARSGLTVIALAALLMAAVSLATGGALKIDPQEAAIVSSWLMGLLAAAYFAYLLFFAGLSASERHRVYVMIALFVAATMYYSAQEQTATSLTLFAERYTDRTLLGWSIPAGVFQSVSSIYILILAPVFSALWIALDRRGRDPSIPVKFAAGLLLMGAGYLVMYVASLEVAAGHRVLPTWLVISYGVQMCGDLCLGPVGLSSMTKLAAPRVAGQVMGIWFLSLALGNNLAGQFAAGYDASHLASVPALFLRMVGWCAIGGVAMLLLTPPLKRLMEPDR
ncbi:MAG: peptide MFS transporter [Steroidobacteraceae bacterium]|jgi:POT family proton-dependent oligopeptide transporter